MNEIIDPSRRDFLKITAVAGGGLLVGFALPGCERGESGFRSAGSAFSPNSWIHLHPNDHVTLMLGSSEMGQGVMTALPMILADELEADWSKVKVEFAPVHADFNNPNSNSQSTGGSNSVRGYWKALRTAGASAREMLVLAAARTWSVPASECRAERGQVQHAGSGRRLRYGELLTAAAKIDPPVAPKLKSPDEFRLIGRATPRVDTPVKVNGAAVFGQDVRVTDMLTAVVARCPIIGGSLKRYDAKATLALPGVRHVLAIDSGVAVVADNYWSAERGRAALQVEWTPGPNAELHSKDITSRLRAAAKREGEAFRNDGDTLTALAGAKSVIEAEYETPYLAHACMEPMNCTVHVRSDRCDVWVPTQAQTQARDQTAKITGLPPASVHIHTTFIGGGFGRRLRPDFVVEAVKLGKALAKPVKVLWTREDDMRHGFFRPANHASVRATLGADGRPLAWHHRVAGPKPALGGLDVPYALPNLRLERVLEDPGVPSGPWRSVGASQNVFSVECFVDELAHAAGKDPVEYRLSLLKPDSAQFLTLSLAAEKAGWKRAASRGHGRGRGVAVCHSYEGCVAYVVEVTVLNRKITVDRVVAAVDCGLIVNPDGVVAQTESAVIFALTAALKGEITINGGRVVQGNFNDYPLLTMAETPVIEVHLLKNDAPPGGVGEPGVPPLAPAVANAVFAATGQRLRRLPLRL